jgi:16S rRNA (uracil1498-N3)-methyltransferase
VHRFYIPPENWDPDSLLLSGSEAHHARHVLRMERGAKALLFNGCGCEITAEIVELGRAHIRLRKLHQTETPPLRCRITLGQAIPKGKNMDLIVQKAVELGAAEIAPIISARTIINLDARQAGRKQTKWQQVAIEAAKQCGQNWLPRVHTPRTLKEFFSVAAVELHPPGRERRQDSEDFRIHRAPLQQLHLIGSLQPDAQHLKKILADYSSEHQHLPTSVLMMVGPEGDFTPAELAFAKTHGCLPITLGPIILRVETAAIYCLSVLSYELL